jgi:para-nitrobenzyl esterase
MLSILWQGLVLGLGLSGCATSPESKSASALEVETRRGAVVGREQEGVRRYLGIPFAAPPVGDLRFRAPRAVESWLGRLEADEFGPVCAQARVQSGAFEVEGDEDCLYLNVYVPVEESSEFHDGRPEASDEEAFPVLVWIHGGGRRVGNGRRDVADFVRETRSIVVTIQYRLSHFAFFAHPALTAEDPGVLASGNYGFQDAIAALEWVRGEIEAFGGDAGRITIGGLSGGGSMVCGLLVSPEAAGLFDRALIQSGSSCWFPTDPIEVAERRGRSNARALGCDSGEAGEVATCLRAQPVAAFYEALGRMLDNPFPVQSTESFAAMPMLGARSGHQVDGYVFPRSWPSAFHSGAFIRVPVMMGTTHHEGRLIYGQLLYDMGSHAFGQEDYHRALLGLTGSEEMARATAERFPLDLADSQRLSAAEQFADVATDAHYRCPLAEMAQAIGRFTPTYLYEYRVPGPLVSDRIELGAYHGADTDTLFGDGFSEALRPFGPRQTRAARTLRGYVARFLRTGDPNGAGLPNWPAHRESSGSQHLAFDDEPHAEAGLREEVCEFWRDARWEALPRF